MLVSEHFHRSKGAHWTTIMRVRVVNVFRATLGWIQHKHMPLTLIARITPLSLEKIWITFTKGEVAVFMFLSQRITRSSILKLLLSVTHSCLLVSVGRYFRIHLTQNILVAAGNSFHFRFNVMSTAWPLIIFKLFDHLSIRNWFGANAFKLSMLSLALVNGWLLITDFTNKCIHSVIYKCSVLNHTF